MICIAGTWKTSTLLILVAQLLAHPQIVAPPTPACLLPFPPHPHRFLFSPCSLSPKLHPHPPRHDTLRGQEKLKSRSSNAHLTIQLQRAASDHNIHYESLLSSWPSNDWASDKMAWDQSASLFHRLRSSVAFGDDKRLA